MWVNEENILQLFGNIQDVEASVSFELIILSLNIFYFIPFLIVCPKWTELYFSVSTLEYWVDIIVNQNFEGLKTTFITPIPTNSAISNFNYKF